MTTLVSPPAARTALPDHTQLPETDGSIAENFQELPQNMLLTGSIMPLLAQRHPDGRFAIGHDSGIYWMFELQWGTSPKAKMLRQIAGAVQANRANLLAEWQAN